MATLATLHIAKKNILICEAEPNLFSASRTEYQSHHGRSEWVWFSEVSPCKHRIANFTRMPRAAREEISTISRPPRSQLTRTAFMRTGESMLGSEEWQ